jgi:hypothetical protein
MADGDWLLTDDGTFILDADGNRQLSNGVDDTCCCGADGDPPNDDTDPPQSNPPTGDYCDRELDCGTSGPPTCPLVVPGNTGNWYFVTIHGVSGDCGFGMHRNSGGINTTYYLPRAAPGACSWSNSYTSPYPIEIEGFTNIDCTGASDGGVFGGIEVALRIDPALTACKNNVSLFVTAIWPGHGTVTIWEGLLSEDTGNAWDYDPTATIVLPNCPDCTPAMLTGGYAVAVPCTP